MVASLGYILAPVGKVHGHGGGDRVDDEADDLHVDVAHRDERDDTAILAGREVLRLGPARGGDPC